MAVSTVGELSSPVRPRNDPGQYDDLAHLWWDRRGTFAMLHWLAAARAELVPPADRPGAVLLDVGCGAGLLAPYLQGRGYRHLGVDVTASALRLAAAHGVAATRADARALPFADGSVDVVVAGEVLEHVPGMPRVVAELARVLRPGGTLVLDTIAATWFGRFSSITVGERVPAGPPRRLHDPALFIDRDRLRTECARHGIELRLTGLRPSVVGYLLWLAGLRPDARMVRTRMTAGLFSGVGRKAATPGRPA